MTRTDLEIELCQCYVKLILHQHRHNVISVENFKRIEAEFRSWLSQQISIQAIEADSGMFIDKTIGKWLRAHFQGTVVGEEIEEPNFKHDCDECIFLSELILGKYQSDNHFDHLLWDLYYCRKGPGETLIARFGNGGHQYISGMELGRHGTVKPLAIAFQKACEKELIR